MSTNRVWEYRKGLKGYKFAVMWLDGTMTRHHNFQSMSNRVDRSGLDVHDQCDLVFYRLDEDGAFASEFDFVEFNKIRTEMWKEKIRLQKHHV